MYILIGFILFSPLFINNFFVYAQSSDGIQIVDIRVESFDLPLTVDSAMIVRQSALIPGKKITGEDLQESMRLLWKLQLFEQIEIVKEREVAGGYFLVIRVKEYPRLEELRIIGNKKIKSDEIREKIQFNRGQILRGYDLFQAVQKIKNLYFEQGYLAIQIDTKVEDGSTKSSKKVTIKIREGKKVRIKKIEFFAKSSQEKLPFSQRKLRSIFKETKQRGFLRSGKFNEDKYVEDKEKLLTYFQNHGYRDASIVKDTIIYWENGKHLSIYLTIDTGPKYYFGNIQFEGQTVYSEKELLSKLAFKKNDVFSKEKLELGGTETIRGMYLDKGYLASNIMPTLIPRNLSDTVDTLDLQFTIVENHQFTVRKINIEGNTKTKERVIRREIVQFPGETFDRSKIQRSMRELTILNFFNTVEPDVQPVGESEVDITFRVEEKQTDQANTSIGYSGRDGLIGAIGFTMPNLFGNGQRFVFDWSFGSYYRNFSVSFDEPYLMYPQTSVGVSAYSQRRGGANYGFTETILGGSVRLGRRLSYPDDYFRVNYSYRLEETTYSDFSASFRAQNPRNLEENKPRLSSSITQVITRDSRDNPEFPTSGSVQSWAATLAGGILGGKDKYLKNVITSEWYTPTFWKIVFYHSSEIGILESLTKNPNDIPYVDYFFMGGSGLSYGVPLRGYNDQTIGPQTTVGDYAIGGKSFFKQTAEIRFPIVPQPTIYGLLFAEVGNVWLSPSEIDPSNMKRATGFGIRIFMPIVGLIGLDYGYGFDHLDSNGKRKGEWIPHFQFGRGF
ncbi:MAG: outer membrane protein assembly factor BamA [bacterium]|nr:outer membrane protein assembly factor BamA [bacterium]